jgi:hypothetical protein
VRGSIAFRDCLAAHGDGVIQAKELFQRPRGEGWVVIADGPPKLGGEFAGLAESIIHHADLTYSPRCICASREASEDLRRFLLDLEGLLGVSIAIEPLEKAEYIEGIDAGILFIAGGEAQSWVDALGGFELGSAILRAISAGTMLFAMDGAASALGYWVVEEDTQEPLEGLNWLTGSVILPWLEDPANSPLVRQLLSRVEPLYALGLSGGRILALGAEGQVELWGKAAPTLLLGSGWRSLGRR